MSYYFECAFAPCDSIEEAMKKALALCEESLKHQDEILATDIWYLEHGIHQGTNLGYMVKGLFEYRFLFWEKYNLMALFAGSIAPWQQKQFAAHVCFQNSTDRDYDFDTWNDAIPLFSSQKQAVSALTDDEVKHQYGYDYSEDEDDDATTKKNAYRRRSLLYQRIYELLDLENVLWGRPCKPRRFCMDAINTSEEEFELKLKARAMLRETDESYFSCRSQLHAAQNRIGNEVWFFDKDDTLLHGVIETALLTQNAVMLTIKPDDINKPVQLISVNDADLALFEDEVSAICAKMKGGVVNGTNA